MAKVRLAKIDGYFQGKMKNKELRQLYEIERAKVALAKKIAEMREEKHLNQEISRRMIGLMKARRNKSPQ